MKKLLLLALVPAVFGTIKADIVGDLIATGAAANAEVLDIKKKECPEAAGDAAAFLQQIRAVAYDLDESFGKQIEDKVNQIIQQATGKSITFKQLIAGLANLKKSLTTNPTQNQLNILNIASIVAGQLHEKIKTLENNALITKTKAGQAAFAKLVNFIVTVKVLLTSCKDVGNKTKLDKELAELAKETSDETFSF